MARLGWDIDVDWRKLDPRQYDPRTIVRQALLEDETVVVRSDTPVEVPATIEKVIILKAVGLFARLDDATLARGPGAGAGTRPARCR